jgi:hypothetical protein
MSKTFELAICSLLVLSCAACGQKAEIYGKWYFDRFGGPHGEVVKEGEIAKANNLNKGITFTFTNEDKAVIEHVEGGKMNSSFQYLASHQEIVLQGDTMQIMLLTSDVLELYPISGSKPALFLKRNKDEKTSMSAP